MEVVINTGGTFFRISDLAFEKLIELGWKVTEWDENCIIKDISAPIVRYNEIFINEFGYKYSFHRWNEKTKELRTNEELISIVKKLGKLANCNNAELKIVEVPDEAEWEIEPFRGTREIIREKHRLWG